MSSSKGSEFRKVINNNDFNGNSRVQYAISPRGLRDRELQFENGEKSIYQGDGRFVNSSVRSSDMGNGEFIVGHNYGPMQQGKIVQSGVHVGVVGLPQYESQVIESSHNSQFRQPHVQNQRLLTIPQNIHSESINPRSP